MDKNARLVKEVFNKNASFYQERFMDVSLYAESIGLFCKNLPYNGSVLELACGPGNITRHMLDKYPGLNILGTDIAENMIDLARQNCQEANFELLDCRDIGKLDEKFNGVMIGFVFPYLSKEDCLQVIADAAALLEPKGMIYISTMEDDYATSGWRTSSKGDKVYMYNHEEGYLAGALKDSGFRIVDTQRKHYDGWDGKPVTDLILIGILG
ncbi:class I SAM-dependent methyltransferase [Flavobacterium sp. MFBS3-15]|uniref:class I SAM-dependent methyltransferase n=1 Tax=Flavobacterium sp. MFBS3-15 TaxID=2989816 RepID=UPI002236B4C1|nr:class I SAM-dependent methyltransferase [Flavobacterium sp. MFBS3-15]MCW4468472.1 class I SAM-dependent methyltransferase [Flavobacterium sp. MFBS3-15]